MSHAVSVIPCRKDPELRAKIKDFAATLRAEAHTLGNHGLSASEFHSSGLFRGAIERIRGQFAATTKWKRQFVQLVLDYMQDKQHIAGWESAGEANRHDYKVRLNSGRTAVIESKGCLDGNNTNIFERPADAHEFIIWSVCTNLGADPRHNAWSGIHTRLSAKIIEEKQQVDGVVIWDMACGTVGRPCPKLSVDRTRLTQVGPHALPPPCIYLLPATIPSPRNNPCPRPQRLSDVGILRAFVECFGGLPEELNTVEFSVAHQGRDTVRTTRIRRANKTQKESKPTPIQWS